MTKRKESILITGAAGYIGSHVIKELTSYGSEIVALDNLSTGYKEAIASEIILYQADFSDLNSLKQIFSKHKIKSVMHFAAKTSVTESIENPELYMDHNYNKLVSFANFCKSNSVENFVFSSTAAVYGDSSKEMISEDHPTKALSAYGNSKLLSERHLESISDENFKCLSLRYFNVAGAHEDGDIGQSTAGTTSLIKACALAACGKIDHLEIYGTDYPTNDGTCERDFIHVVDLAKAHIAALDYLSQGGHSQVLNCGYGKSFSVKQVVRCMKEQSGVDFSVLEKARRDGDIVKSCSDTSKIHSTLNWVPENDSLEKICLSAYLWEKNPKY